MEFVAFAEYVVSKIKERAAAIDHIDRAADSITLNIANGNSRWSESDRIRFFDVAYGSALECAACLDVLWVKSLISREDTENGKLQLVEIVNMLVGLRRRHQTKVEEDTETYPENSKSHDSAEILFNHERLDVYQLSLQYVRWAHEISQTDLLDTRYQNKLDKLSTSILLNIAEGNGRFAVLDQRRFLDIAQNSALNSAACLDVIRVRKNIPLARVDEGKEMLFRIVSMLIAMRNRLGDKGSESGPKDTEFYDEN